MSIALERIDQAHRWASRSDAFSWVGADLCVGPGEASAMFVVRRGCAEIADPHRAHTWVRRYGNSPSHREVFSWVGADLCVGPGGVSGMIGLRGDRGRPTRRTRGCAATV